MSEEQRPAPAFWAQLRRHPAFQAAMVFGAGSWLAVQAADVFGMDTILLRWLGAAAVLVLLVLAGVAVVGVLRRGEGAALRGVRPRTAGLVAAALLLAATGAWVARPYVFGSVRPGADVIAVLPFQSSGPGVELLGEGLVDLLSANLDEVGPIRTVNPRTMLHHYRQHAQNGSIDLEGALRVGRAAGAGSVVTGSVVSAGGSVRVTAELHGVDGGRVLARAQKSGTADNVFALVDELSLELVRDIWRAREPLPELRVSAITTSSIAAVRAYMRGEQFYRRVQWDSAAVAFEEAVAHDSTFALAHFRLAETYGWREALGSDQARRHSEAAARFADRLPARERMLVVAHQLHEFGNVAAIDSFQAYANRYPDDVAGWYMLADARFHAAPVLGGAVDQLRAGFERVHEMDPTYAQAYAHLFEVALMTGDSGRYDGLLARFRAVAPEEAAVYELLRTVRWAERSVALDAVHRMAESGGQRNTVLNRAGMASAMRTFGTPADPDFLKESLDRLQQVLGPAARGLLAASHAVALGSTGRMRDADRVLDPLRQTEQALGAALPYITSGLAPADAFRPERDALRRAPPSRGASYWRAVGALSAGDASAAAREIAAARRDTASRGADIPPPMFDGLAAWLDIVNGDTVGGVARLRAAVIAIGYSPQLAGFGQPLRLQLAVVQAARADTRAEGLRRLELMAVTEPQNFAFIQRPLADAWIAEGRPDRAAAALARFTELWAHADAELQPMVTAARTAIGSLAGERAAAR